MGEEKGFEILLPETLTKDCGYLLIFYSNVVHIY